MNRSEGAIFKKALDTYGICAQINMVFEEMAELQKELCKNLRGARNRDHIAEEIADVEIMLEQMKFYFCIGQEVSAIRAKKVDRLYERLEKVKEAIP